MNWFLENSRSEYAFILIVLLWTKCVVSVSPRHYFAPLRQNWLILFLPSLFSVIKWKSESFIKSEWHLKPRANRKISHVGSSFSSFLLNSHLLIKYCTFQQRPNGSVKFTEGLSLPLTPLPDNSAGLPLICTVHLSSSHLWGGCNWSYIEAILLISASLWAVHERPRCCGQRPISFCSLPVWTVASSRPAFGCCSSLSQTNMTADVSGSRPFKQPFNKTSSAVRHTGSLVLGSPAENTLPPVSKPSAFGSPRRASIILRGLFKLAAKVSPFFIHPTMWHLGEIFHIWNRFSSLYRSRFRHRAVGASIPWQGEPVAGFWCGAGLAAGWWMLG